MPLKLKRWVMVHKPDENDMEAMIASKPEIQTHKRPDLLKLVYQFLKLVKYIP